MRTTFDRVLLLIGTCAVCVATSSHAQSANPSAECEQAAQVAERAYALPSGLLNAIGQVESGRWDPGTRRVRPWPWTLNAEGVGAYSSDHASAVAAVAALQARGARSIDIGCFQVNLLHHPKAFPTLADGFAPGLNADYAARFLSNLYSRTRSWPEAVAAYHSATPGLGEVYWTKVSTAWNVPSPPGRDAVQMQEPRSVPGVKVWTPRTAGTAPTWIFLGSATADPAVAYLATRAESKR